MLNGGGMVTSGGSICAPHGPAGMIQHFEYGYDSSRDDGNGGTYLTFHNRKNVQQIC